MCVGRPFSLGIYSFTFTTPLNFGIFAICFQKISSQKVVSIIESGLYFDSWPLYTISRALRAEYCLVGIPHNSYLCTQQVFKFCNSQVYMFADHVNLFN